MVNLLCNCSVTWTKPPGCNTAPRDQSIMRVRCENNMEPRGQQQLLQKAGSLKRVAKLASLEEGQTVEPGDKQGGRVSVFNRLHGADPTAAAAVAVDAAGGGGSGSGDGLNPGPVSWLCPQGSAASSLRLDRRGSAAASGRGSSCGQQKTSVQKPFGSSGPACAPMTMVREDEPWDGDGDSRGYGYGNMRGVQPRIYNDEGLGSAGEGFSPELVAATAKAMLVMIITRMKSSGKPRLQIAEVEALQSRGLSIVMQEVVKVRWGWEACTGHKTDANLWYSSSVRQ